MEKIEKYEMMNKVLRGLDDIKNSETSLLKKIAQIEAENINLGIGMLDRTLPNIHEMSDNSIQAIDKIIEEFTEYKDKFARDNKLEVDVLATEET